MRRAEKKFRDAFELLKAGKPQILPKGSAPTQNNVAREAGVDPSALRASRFPDLVREINAWKLDSANTPPHSGTGRKAKRRSAKHVDQDLKNQRDHAQALLVQAELRIVELTVENARLRALQAPRNVAPLRS